MMYLFLARLLLLKPGLMHLSLRTLPSENFQDVADQFTKYDIQGLLIVGGFEVRPIILLSRKLNLSHVRGQMN